MQLGKYEILEELGLGGFGIVYKAHDTVLGRDVALKVLHPQLAADADFVERFRKEARMLAKLEHPNIVPIYDAIEIDGRYCILMRFLPGGNLTQKIKQSGCLTYAQALTVLQNAIMGLTYAHSKGVIHRDIKPSNILFDQNGTAVLSDFGLARISQMTSATSAFSGAGGVGTPFYRAPELWQDEKGSMASDQYSLACVFIEMVTGIVLFDGKSPPAVMLKHFQPVQLPAAWSKEIPADIKAALLQALSIDAAERHTSLHAFLEKLSIKTTEPIEIPRARSEPFRFNSKASTLRAASIENQNDALRDRKWIPVQNSQSKKAGIEWIAVPGGKFLYGKDRAETWCDGFCISKFSVTNAQYKLFLEENPRHQIPTNWDPVSRIYPKGKKKHPVVFVSYSDAVAYCLWAGCRLPTEEQWEKAARGTDGRDYPWGNKGPDGTNANNEETGIFDTTPVDKYANGVSPYGVWDMAGNIWEWTSSSDKSGTVLRGGGWSSNDESLRVTIRGHIDPGSAAYFIGFRCVTDLTEEK